jgi:hypothetical protein
VNGVIDLLRQLNIPLRDAWEWHTVPRDVARHLGCINGIPSLHGNIVAANGGVAIMLRNGEPCLVHHRFFVKDAGVPASLSVAQKPVRLTTEEMNERYEV